MASRTTTAQSLPPAPYVYLVGVHPGRIGSTGPPAHQRDDRGHDERDRERGDDVNVQGECRSDQCAPQHRRDGDEATPRSRPDSPRDRAIGCHTRDRQREHGRRQVRNGELARGGTDLAPIKAPNTNETNATGDAGMENPLAPANANPRNTTFPVMFATKT